MPRPFLNPEKVFQTLATQGPLNKWDIKDTTLLPYPRVNEAINSLQKANLIRVIGRKTSKKNLEMKIYGLTFKGALKHLASIHLEPPSTISTNEEPPEEFTKRTIDEYKNYANQAVQLNNFLKSYGKNFNFVIFQEIDWLSNNYGSYIYELILEISNTNLSVGTPYLNREIKKVIAKQKDLKKTLQIIKRTPSLGKALTVTDKGAGDKEVQEIDVHLETENRLRLLEEQITAIQTGEDEFLKNSFAYAFLERLALMKRRGASGNESLCEFARNLLEKRREQTIIPLEKVVKEFGLPKTA